eukprot:CAMPEP_0175430078 /NCGR_PEP_ID=MMETSP0095-20121207/51683_1 /TAXON_ID=311494 /ORGANISM="Alexandrium monilatum, Strain CCMP3105" /LENGTH=43 /DNA_ID= /DNA_START= /DNA_END= /DNA_ORIENTATION=
MGSSAVLTSISLPLKAVLTQPVAGPLPETFLKSTRCKDSSCST